jgi:hypothetical protein
MVIATVTTGPAATNSNTVAITIGPAAKLGFTTQPSASTGGVAFPAQPRVAIRDAGGNTVTTSTDPVTLTMTQPSSPAGAALTCTSANPRNAVVGVATFAGCKIDLASAPTYTLRATATTGLTAATSSALTITVGAPARVVFSQQPSASTAAAAAFASQPIVTVQDAGGNTVTSDNASSVTLDLTRPSTPAAAILTCTSNTVTVTAGVATFAGCNVDLVGTYTLKANDTTDVLTKVSTTVTIT